MAECTARKQLVKSERAVQIVEISISPVNLTCYSRWWAVQMKDMAKCTARKQVIYIKKAVQMWGFQNYTAK